MLISKELGPAHELGLTPRKGASSSNTFWFETGRDPHAPRHFVNIKRKDLQNLQFVSD